VEVVASLSQGRTTAAQCGLFTHKSVPVVFEPPCIYIYATTHKFVMLCFTYAACIVCISVKSPFVRTTNSKLFLPNALYNNAQNILYIYTFFKVSCFQRRRSNRATRGWGRVSHVFLAGWSACSSLIFCKFLVGAMRPLEKPLATGVL